MDSLLVNEKAIERFTLDEPATGLSPARARVFQRFADAPVVRWRAAFVEVLHEGNYTLLKQYKKVLHPADYRGAYTSGRRYIEIEDVQLYYLRRPDGSVVPVKLTLKSLTAAAPELAEKLKVAAATAKTDTEWAVALQTSDPR